MNVNKSFKITFGLCVGLFSQVLNAQTLIGYESLAQFSPKLYILQFERTFDAAGIVTQKKEYHPLTISFYGIMNYDAFKTTGDSSYYKHVVNQFNYFKDTSKLIFSDNGTCVGLPYRFNYKGLKAPWFSGMTQGVATSFLLRYYELTGDKYALDLSQKIVRFMLKTEADGGTIGRTKEGGPWIEEYPAYASSKSVLNGFINGLIGLKEYCDFFPNDTYAKAMHDSCYNEMIEHIHVYDTPNWTTYNRNGGAITNSYMRYELEEFDHLYSIYGDERLRRQMKIWARFAIGKFDKEWKFLILPKYDFSKEITFDFEKKGFDFDVSKSFMNGLQELSTQKNGSKLRAVVPQKTNYLQISQMDGESSRKFQIKVLVNGKEVPCQLTKSDSSITVESDIPFDEVQIKLKKRQRKDLRVMAYNYRSCELPQFACFSPCSPKYISKGQKITAVGNGIHLTNGVVFYRCGSSNDDLKKQLFRQSNSFNLNEGGYIAQETGMYEFFVSYDITHPVSSLRNFEIQVSD